MSQTVKPPIRLTIAQGMWGIAACAVVCAWPILLFLLVPIALLAFFEKRYPVYVEALVVAVIIGVLAALILPAVHTNCRSRRTTTAPTPLANFAIDDPDSITRLTFDGQEKARPIWSPDGKRLAFARHESGGSHIWQYVMDADAPKSAKRITSRKGPDFHAAFFPDGKRLVLAVVEQSGTQGNLDLATIGVDGSDLKRVVSDGGKLWHQDWPSPSPDGARFAFSSTQDGNQEIYTAKADGTDIVRLTQSPGHDAHPSWSPKGDRIAFATDRWGGLEIASVKTDGTGLTRLTKSPGIDDFPSYSPDGSRLAFVSHRDGNAEIYLMDADGSNCVNLSNHSGRDTQPSWMPDGSGVTFVSDREGGVDLYTMTVAAEIARPSDEAVSIVDRRDDGCRSGDLGGGADGPGARGRRSGRG